MEVNLIFIIVLIGFLAGIVSGALGIGGGVIIIPALIFMLGYPAHLAQGTTLAMMVPPIGLPAFISYYRKKQVDLKAALILMGLFLIGSYWGSLISVSLPENTLRKGFALLMLIIGVKMIIPKKQ